NPDMDTKKNTKEASKKTIGILCALTGGMLWGISGVCGQYLFQNKGVTATWLVPIRLTSAGLFLLLYFLLRDHKRALSVWKEKRNAKDILVYAIAGMMLCQYSYFQTIEWSNAGTATVIQYLGSAMTVVYICISERQRPKRKEILAVLLALCGIFLIATHGKPGSLALSGRALGMGLLSAVGLVIYTVKPRRLLTQFPSPLILAWGMLIGGIVLSAVMRPWNHMPQIDAELIGVLLVIICLGTMASFSLYLHSVSLIGPVQAGLYACIEPVAATVFSVIWMKETFVAIDLLGFVLIIATVFVLAAPEKE
ncbi:MAG: DMT family transporter, partial [Lachnospiraceae bacterium]|nr:DMT family transporter [Lachnospiraceae bacterium]